MMLSSTAQTTLLLTGQFSKHQTNMAKPLTMTEWSRFAIWLKNNEINPSDLLSVNASVLLKNWSDADISVERIVALLKRGHSLAIALEKWQRAGLWLVTRSDDEYPKRLKLKLRNNAPPVLFGCGSSALLNIGGMAVVGSRNANNSDLEFASNLGHKAASENIGIISGAARGIDEAAMQGAINASGKVIGVLADSLLKAATSMRWRAGLSSKHLVLLSPFYPEASFSVGNAMARNKYIYCLADTALVVHANHKGGTISGATENLTKGWVSLWVKPTNDPKAANTTLVSQGGQWCAEDIQSISLPALVSTTLDALEVRSKQTNRLASIECQTDLFDSLRPPQTTQPRLEQLASVLMSNLNQNNLDPTNETPFSFYQIFVQELARLAKQPITIEDLVSKTVLHKAQVTIWLKRALDEGLVKKLIRPIRYQYLEKSI